MSREALRNGKGSESWGCHGGVAAQPIIFLERASRGPALLRYQARCARQRLPSLLTRRDCLDHATSIERGDDRLRNRSAGQPSDAPVDVSELVAVWSRRSRARWRNG